jgi:hypothetical protein
VTLDELLDIARRILPDVDRPRVARVAEIDKLARAVLDVLGAQPPCGWPLPRAITWANKACVVWPEAFDDEMSPDEAIALGVALIRAGLEAKGDGR